MNEASVYLPFQTIENCRDLAGMKTQDGRVIAPGRLIRSAHLGNADEHDLMTLSGLGISDVVDFRTDGEVLLKRDRTIPDAVYHHDSVYRERDLKEEAGSQLRLVEEAALNSRKMLEGVYLASVRDRDSIEAWKEFFKILKAAKGGVLFHCTQGKDRTGIGAMLIETALGVEPQTVFDDYMQTNLYTAREAAEDRLMAEEAFSHHDRRLQADIDTFLFAHEDCFQLVDRTIREGWGSWQNYLHEAIGLSDDDLKALQEKYLISAGQADRLS